MSSFCLRLHIAENHLFEPKFNEHQLGLNLNFVMLYMVTPVIRKKFLSFHFHNSKKRINMLFFSLEN